MNGMFVQPLQVAFCVTVSVPDAKRFCLPPYWFWSYRWSVYVPGERVAEVSLPFHVVPEIVMLPVIPPADVDIIPALFSPP